MIEHEEELRRLKADNDALYALVARENAKRFRLEAALKEARRVLVIACGTEAPYIKIALERIDAALTELTVGGAS